VKLRLRGKDSGHKDVNTGIKKETSEPLHLCISAKTEDRYNQACDLSEKLLHVIYKD